LSVTVTVLRNGAHADLPVTPDPETGTIGIQAYNFAHSIERLDHDLQADVREPPRDPLEVRKPVGQLVHVQRSARLQDAPDLRERGGEVRDRAERPRRQRGVEAVVGEGKRLAVQAGPLDGDRRGAHALRAQLPTHVRRLDGQEALFSYGRAMTAESPQETLSRVAQGDAPVLERLVTMNLDSLKGSGLDARTYFLVQLAALGTPMRTSGPQGKMGAGRPIRRAISLHSLRYRQF
jgi:hypothetical protein